VVTGGLAGRFCGKRQVGAAVGDRPRRTERRAGRPVGECVEIANDLRRRGEFGEVSSIEDNPYKSPQGDDDDRRHGGFWRSFAQNQGFVALFLAVLLVGFRAVDSFLVLLVPAFPMQIRGSLWLTVYGSAWICAISGSLLSRGVSRVFAVLVLGMLVVVTVSVLTIIFH
jgi:hypothetical protein